MTPDQIDTVTNGLIAVHTMADVYGPGLLLAAACVAVGWTCRRAAGAIYDRRQAAATRRQIRRIENYANHPAARTATRDQHRKGKP